MHFIADDRGNTGILFAVASILIFGAAGIAVDYARWSSQRTQLQAAADAGALAGVVELGYGGAGVVTRAKERAVALTDSNVDGYLENATADVVIDKTAETVTVSLSIDGERTLSRLLVPDNPKLTAQSTAKVAGRSIACIYALNPTASMAFRGNGTAIVQATDCAIYVNSDASDALANSGIISASHICVVGGFTGDGYTPSPQENCPTVSDPFLNIATPAPGGCDHFNLALNADAILDPGVYCGGLHVSGNARITLNPGLYFLADGVMQVTSGGSIEGAEVAFILYGSASIDIAGNGAVITTPPLSGDAAGFSIMQHREAPFGEVSKIAGDGRFEFPGIIYLPRQALEIAGRAEGNVNTPTYAAIVADTITVTGSGDLYATADSSMFGKNAAQQITVVNAKLVK